MQSPINGTISAPNVATFGKRYLYPDGSYDLIAADYAAFKPAGWEPIGAKIPQAPTAKRERSEESAKRENEQRAARRAKAKVRRLALANEFEWFVTLTYNPDKVDSFNAELALKRMSQWCSNQVQRRGLRYILVPEYHKSGRVHLHGFFSGDLLAEPSGRYADNGQPIYNLPGWDYGYTTAVQLYGEYPRAVNYVCKYIGKDGKIGGRWYYSGGPLAQPKEEYIDLSAGDLIAQAGGRAWVISKAGKVYAGINGIKGEEHDE